MNEIKPKESSEIKAPETNTYKDIKPENGTTYADSLNYWNEEIFDKISNEQNIDSDKTSIESIQKGSETVDAKEADNLYTSLQDRVDKASESDGTWTGDVGNSKFIPSTSTEEGIAAKNKLSECGMDGVDFKNGVPDFSKLAVETVKIDMTGDRTSNYTKIYEAVADKWNSENKDGRSDWTARDAKTWKQENGLSPHECSDMKTVQFVPTSVHSFVKHYGGVAECKARDKILNGGKSDE